MVLDIATGTGRLRRALRLAESDARVVGLDHSRPMLLEGARVAADGSRPLIQADARSLPIASGAVDAVACLEALEFMPSMPAAFAEMARVLRPGGLLVATNRKGAARWFMPGHVVSRERMERMLTDAGFAGVRFERWQVDYDLVMAQRAVTRDRSGA